MLASGKIQAKAPDNGLLQLATATAGNGPEAIYADAGPAILQPDENSTSQSAEQDYDELFDTVTR